MKRFKNLIFAVIALLVIVPFVLAETVSVRPYGIATPYWYGYSAGAQSTYYLEHPTLTANDQVVSENATQTLTNKTLTSPTIGTGITGTGVISATNIADITRSIHLDLASAWLNGTGMLGNDGTTAPGISTTGTDGIPAIVYASSAETASIGWTFSVPADYSTALAFRMLVSTDTNTATSGFGMGWALFSNRDATTFSNAITQTGVTLPAGTKTPAASNAMLTFTVNATGLAAITAGDWVTVYFWNADTRAAASTTEIKGVEARYTSVQ